MVIFRSWVVYVTVIPFSVLKLYSTFTFPARNAITTKCFVKVVIGVVVYSSLILSCHEWELSGHILQHPGNEFEMEEFARFESLYTSKSYAKNDSSCWYLQKRFIIRLQIPDNKKLTLRYVYSHVLDYIESELDLSSAT